MHLPGKLIFIYFYNTDNFTHTLSVKSPISWTSDSTKVLQKAWTWPVVFGQHQTGKEHTLWYYTVFVGVIFSDLTWLKRVPNFKKEDMNQKRNLPNPHHSSGQQQPAAAVGICFNFQLSSSSSHSSVKFSLQSRQTHPLLECKLLPKLSCTNTGHEWESKRRLCYYQHNKESLPCKWNFFDAIKRWQ